MGRPVLISYTDMLGRHAILIINHVHGPSKLELFQVVYAGNPPPTLPGLFQRRQPVMLPECR